MENYFRDFKIQENYRFILLLVAVLAIGSGIIASSVQRNNIPTDNLISPPSDISVDKGVNQDIEPITDQTLVYGTWQDGQTFIRAVNTDGTYNSIIAKLPFDIKDVNVVSSSYLLYIADTNSQDHGQKIVLYDLVKGEETALVTAAEKWGVDDIVVSPDKTWIAWWEVALGPDKTLLGGRSRVYTAALNFLGSLDKHLIFDETASIDTAVHYPLFFDHQNNLYSDTFKPNTGAGAWNLGLFKTSAQGGYPIQVLLSGDYNSDPKLNPTRNIIVYTAYNPTSGVMFSAKSFSLLSDDGTGLPSDDFLNPNDVRILDLNTMEKKSILSQPGYYYNDTVWSHGAEAVYVRSFRFQNSTLTDAQVVKVDIDTGQINTFAKNLMPEGVFIASTVEGFLTGEPLESSTPANLGSTYAPQLSSIMLGYGESAQTLANGPLQYIDLVFRPSNKTLGMDFSLAEKAESLKLGTFSFKPNIEKRTTQQTDGKVRCRDLYNRLTNEGSLPSSTDFKQWKKEVRKGFVKGYKCYDSPLYLYSPTEIDVKVKVKNAEIVSANPEYNQGWKVTSRPSGTKIEYTYVSSFTVPKKGFLVPKENIGSFLSEYAKRAGLAGWEITDFVAFWTNQLPQSPYYFASHFEKPEQIMNLNIDPVPDTFIQVVMYFRPVSRNQAQSYKNLTPLDFIKVPPRQGFVAVDWSGIIDY